MLRRSRIVYLDFTIGPTATLELSHSVGYVQAHFLFYKGLKQIVLSIFLLMCFILLVNLCQIKADCRFIKLMIEVSNWHSIEDRPVLEGCCVNVMSNVEA